MGDETKRLLQQVLKGLTDSIEALEQLMVTPPRDIDVAELTKVRREVKRSLAALDEWVESGDTSQLVMAHRPPGTRPTNV